MHSNDRLRSRARRAMRGPLATHLVLLVALLDLSLAATQAAARSAEARLTIDVPARAWKGVRLKNIPAGAALGVEVDSDGPVAVLLLGAADFARFPGPGRPVFEGKTADRLSIAVLAPETGDYYVLLDNRDGSGGRSVVLTLKGDSDPGETGDAGAP